MPKSNTIRTMYGDYQQEHDSPLSYKEYRDCCELFNIKAMNAIIYDGKKLNMGHYLSTISIIKIERNFKNPQVNWGATNKYKKALLSGEAEEAPPEGYNEEDLYSKDNEDGVKYFIYYTDDWYCRFYWYKKGCKVKNKSVYTFKPTRGDKGNKTKLKEALRDNSLQHKKYRYVKNS